MPKRKQRSQPNGEPLPKDRLQVAATLVGIALTFAQLLALLRELFR